MSITVGYAVILFSAIHLTDGGDYVTGPFIVNFTAGLMYATLMVSTVDDTITELSEYFRVEITSTSQPGVVEIGSLNMSFITIEDNDPGNVQPTVYDTHCFYTQCCFELCFNVSLSTSLFNGKQQYVRFFMQAFKCRSAHRTTLSLKMI